MEAPVKTASNLHIHLFLSSLWLRGTSIMMCVVNHGFFLCEMRRMKRLDLPDGQTIVWKKTVMRIDIIGNALYVN